mmetsp:Transcript_64726/g.131623  ORF Transcript_64726/g.131623 Transcript_64726/m.131623 type:complete len:567 (+) Transcript_64726:2266-3966(+)
MGDMVGQRPEVFLHLVREVHLGALLEALDQLADETGPLQLLPRSGAARGAAGPNELGDARQRLHELGGIGAAESGERPKRHGACRALQGRDEGRDGRRRIDELLLRGLLEELLHAGQMGVGPAAAALAALCVHIEESTGCACGVTPFQLHAVESVDGCILDIALAAPHETQNLIEGTSRRRDATQAQFHYHANGLGHIGRGARDEERAQAGLGCIDQLDKVHALGVAVMHTLQGSPLTLPLRAALAQLLALGSEVSLHLRRDGLLRHRLLLEAARHRLRLRCLLLLNLGRAVFPFGRLLILLLLCFLGFDATPVGGELGLGLGRLLGIELLEAVRHLFQELLRLSALVARALESGAVGMELDERAHQLHRGLAAVTCSVLHALDRDLQHAGPLVAGQRRVAGIRCKVREGLQGAEAYPDALVQRARHQRFEQVLLRRMCDGEVNDRASRALPLRSALLNGLLASFFLGRITIATPGTMGQLLPLCREQLADGLDDGAPERVAIHIQEGKEHGDVGEDNVRQALGRRHQEGRQRALEGALRAELSGGTVLRDFHEEKAWQRRGMCKE